MSIIDSQREQIIRDNNTAQEELEGIISRINPNINQLVLSTPLHGDLDLGILTSRGFRNVKHIVLEPGEITSIRNVPQSVLSLHCSNQMLVDLFDLPPSLTELVCDYNYISRFSCKGLKKLTKLHISHNRLEELEDLPKDLEELYCTNNKLKLLNLDGLQSLHVLHVSENPAITIENVPEGIVDFKSDNSPFAVIEAEHVDKKKHMDTEIKIEYVEALNVYFRLKKTYEENLLKVKRDMFHSQKTKTAGKRAVATVAPKCINCGRPVGTIFEHKDFTYTAICGDPVLRNKCNLNIKLFSGFFGHDMHYLYTVKGWVDESKTKIVMQKLDTLFSYMSEKDAAIIFKEAMKQYEQYSSEYKQILESVNKKYFNKEKQEQIATKTTELNTLFGQYNAIINDYKENIENQELLKDAVQLYIREIVPKMENLRTLKYGLNEVDTEVNVVAKTHHIKSTLVQKPVKLSEIDETIYLLPKVIHFSKKA
jgi:Leucine-rich repeat (LRR) protein